MELKKVETVKILLADDDKDDCLLFKDALSELPLAASLQMVYDGEQLMELLLKNLRKLPHILFLDLNMPRKNGFECLIEIKQHPELKKLPVTIFSTSFNKEIISILQKEGAWHYVRKPTEFYKLKNLIHKTILLFREEDKADLQNSKFVIKDDGIPIQK